MSEPREDTRPEARRHALLAHESLLTRPSFAAGYPDDPELERLVRLFVRGNHRAVREGVAALLHARPSGAVADAARDLRRRLSPDPIAYVLLGVTLALLVTLSLWARTRSAAMPPAPAMKPTTSGAR
jgi:hypothetical protein